MTSTSPIERRALNYIIIQIILLRISYYGSILKCISDLSINVILFIAIIITILAVRDHIDYVKFYVYHEIITYIM